MFGLQLLEMAHIAEQEHMRRALAMRTRREARAAGDRPRVVRLIGRR